MIRGYYFGIERSTRIDDYYLSCCIVRRSIKMKSTERSPLFSKSRQSKSHVKAFTYYSSIQYSPQCQRLRLEMCIKIGRATADPAFYPSKMTQSKIFIPVFFTTNTGLHHYKGYLLAGGSH